MLLVKAFHMKCLYGFVRIVIYLICFPAATISQTLLGRSLRNLAGRFLGSAPGFTILDQPQHPLECPRGPVTFPNLVVFQFLENFWFGRCGVSFLCHADISSRNIWLGVGGLSLSYHSIIKPDHITGSPVVSSIQVSFLDMLISAPEIDVLCP